MNIKTTNNKSNSNLLRHRSSTIQRNLSNEIKENDPTEFLEFMRIAERLSNPTRTVELRKPDFKKERL
jgi:hypothetical protein